MWRSLTLDQTWQATRITFKYYIAYACVLFCRFLSITLLLPIFLKKNYSLRQYTLKILRVWERSLISVPISVYLGLIEVGIWLWTGSAKQHWRFAKKGRPDVAPDSGFQRSVSSQEVNRSAREWPNAEIVPFLRSVRRWSCIRSSEEGAYRIDKTLAAFGQG